MSVERPVVLVIDDDDDIRDVVSMILADAGYETIAAADGLAGLAALRRGPRPAVVLLDVMMPHMTGQELAVAMQADPALASIPVLFLSGDGQAAEAAAATKAAGILHKPIEMHDLLAAVARFAPGTPAEHAPASP